MKCLKCNRTKTVTSYMAHRTSDWDTWRNYRSVIPLTGLLAIGLKHLFCSKIRIYVCSECNIGWREGEIVYYPIEEE